MDSFEKLMSGSFASGKMASYTEEEIEKARKLSKKNGRTLLENLAELTGKQLNTYDHLQAEIDALNESLRLDSALNGEKIGAIHDAAFGRSDGQKTEAAGDAAASVRPADGPVTFDGLEAALNEKVYGQTAFVKSLVIAFRRPYVLPEESGHAKNVIFLTGPEDTGKHYALDLIAEELHRRGILPDGTVKTIDLSRYPNADSDSVFLQDLYAALASPSRVLLFEHYESCHIACLSYVSELVKTGKCGLSGRYTLQNGQLVAVSNAFATNIVDAFSAEGRYLVFVSDEGKDSLADVFGAPFVDCLGDTCGTAALDGQSLRRISEDRLAWLSEKAEKALSFTLSGDLSGVADEGVSKAGKKADVRGILDFYDDLLKRLADLKLAGDYPPRTDVCLIFTKAGLCAKICGTETLLSSLRPEGYRGDLEKVRAELDGIVGLDEVKAYVLSLEDYFETQKKRREAGLKASEVNKHMIFTGSPGTGKTTIARILSRYLKAIGVLSGGQLVEVSRADLVGRYVGHTAPLTKQVLTSAIGGVLFIDEAYSLYRGEDDSFGLEAIDTLVKGIEDNRDNLIVILAGYSKEMAEFLTANSGLKSRFPNIIDFPDYTGEELLKIAEITAKSKGYVLDGGLKTPLLTYFNTVQAIKAQTAGNGRLVRNKIEEAILNQSKRLVAEPEADLSLLTARDFVLDDIESL